MVAPGAKKPSSSRTDQEALKARHEALALVEEKFRDFDVVWAKVHGFPWWPGVLFHSWDVVRRAGIRTDPKIVASLVVPPAEKVPVLDAASGEETGTSRSRRHCLIMFLDKFNFSLVEIDPSNVASFTAHYQVYEHAVMGSKSSKWGKKKSEFRRALVKAAQLLHMGKEYVEDDLVLLEEPSQAEKKQRMDEVMEVEEDGEGSLEDAWDDRESADDAAFVVDGMAAAEKKPAKKLLKKASNKGKLAAEVKDSEGDDDEVVILTPAKSRRKAPAKDSKSRARKSSRKEVHDGTPVAIVSRLPSPIDLTGTPESEKKRPHATHEEKASGKGSEKPPRPRKKKTSDDADLKDSKRQKNGRAKALVLEDDDVSEDLAEQNGEQVSEEVADIIEEEKPNNLLLTPLSSIWTTGISSDSGNNAGSGVPTQLAYKQDFVWNDDVFTDELSIAEKEKAAIEQKQAEKAAAHGGHGRERSLGKRQSRSVLQSHIRQNLMTGNLDPHTMVQCAAYRPKDYVEDPNSRSRGGPTLDPPFQVVAHPDAVFVADLHAHLATCEIIGFLGGKWDETSKTLYIQAAFPCRSLVIDGDDGSTDVEMDPGSEIELRGIIENAQLEVVGWYHSHPAFAPDPSVRDIENQTSYQQLFQRPSTSKDADGECKSSEPFVGLIVGTYDTRRSTPVSLFRYFHTRGEKVSGGARREIYMPYEFIPGRRHFRNVLQDEEREKTRFFPMYHSVLQHFKLEFRSVTQKLPTDVEAPPAQRATSRSSPSRVKTQGPVRKRKQSSEGTGDKSVKKPRAKSRRSVRSSLATTGHIDLTGDDDIQNLQASENGFVAPKEIHETVQNGSTNITTKEEDRASNGVVVKDEMVVKPVASLGGAKGSTETSSTSTATTKLAARKVEPQVAEVLADVVLVTEAANGERKRSRKAQNPKQINENPSSSGGDESKQLPADNVIVQGSMDALAGQADQHAGNKLSGTSKGLTVQVDAETAASTNANIPQPASLSALRNGMSPSASGNRKRNRKPMKTTKNSNRSTSPPSDVPSAARSPSPTFYNVFQVSGPVVSNGSTHEDVTPPPSRSDVPKEPLLVVDDVHYITIKESMTASSRGDERSAEDKADQAIQSVKTTAEDGHIHPDIRNFVTSLVEKVVEKVALEITASTSSAAVNGSSDRSTDKASMNCAVKVEAKSESLEPMNCAVKAETKSESLEPQSAVNATVSETAGNTQPSNSERNRGAPVHSGPQLFGSNGECEDIQTSLQKMAGYLDILKSSQATKLPSDVETKPQEDARAEAEPMLEVAKPDSKQVESHVEQDHLTALRTKYGPGVSGCAEQVITLVDYYRDFERRTDLSEIWKSRITKLEKIESSLSEYVQFLNIPGALRRDFIKDLISYLRESWATKDRQRRRPETTSR